MPFSRSASGLTRVCEFGAREPTEGLAVFLDEMHRKNNLWNSLVEIDRANRVAVAGIIRTSLDDQIDALRENMTAARKNLKMLRAKAAYTTIEYGLLKHQLSELVREWHSMVAATQFNALEPPAYRQIPVLLFTEPHQLKDIQSQISELAGALRPLYVEAKQRRQMRAVEHKSELDALDNDRKLAAKKAVKESGAHWLNSEEVVNGYELARRAALTTGVQLRFHSWRTEGKISVRYQQGRPADQLFDPGDMRLVVQPMDVAAWVGSRSQRRKLNHTQVKIRCGSNPDGSPIWVTFTALIHRPIPTGAAIRSASLVRRKLGLRYEYRLLLTVRCAMPAEVSIACRPHLSVMLDWMRMEDGALRVASWRDTAGSFGGIILDAGMIGEFEKLDGLQSTTKQYQDAASKAVLELKATTSCEWFNVATDTLAHWESPMRFLKLWRDWKDQRFDGDGSAFELLGTFRERFLHLYPWQCNLRDQLQTHRREIFRIFASDAARRYSQIEIDDRVLVSKGGGQLETNVRKWTRIAAGSVLRNTIKHTAARCGVLVIDGCSSQIDPVPVQTEDLRSFACAGGTQLQGVA